MVPTSAVNFKEELGPMQFIKHIIQSGNGESILAGNVVCDPRINAQMPSPIFLRDQKAETEMRTQLSLIYPQSSKY